MIEAVLLDVGGTLWPDAWPESPEDVSERTLALRRLEPRLSEREAGAIVAELSRWRHPPGERQQTADVVRDTVARVTPQAQVDARHAIRAMSIPARGRVALFPGARRLLESLHERHIRVVLATNVAWRSGEDHFRDLEDLGVSDYVSACVTSLDVGWRKPRSQFFAAALDAAGCPAANCVMVGDSETNDILPARALGMLTIKVVTERDLSGPTAASYLCTSLDYVNERIIGRPR